jgi:ubiquinone biosynthesis protein UbiJ
MPSVVATSSEFNALLLEVNVLKEAVAKLVERINKLESRPSR